MATVTIRIIFIALLFMWLSSAFCLPLSPGPGCFRARRTAKEQNNLMLRKSKYCGRTTQMNMYKLFEDKINMQSTPKAATIIHTTAEHASLYLRGLNFRKVIGWTTAT